VLRVVNVTLIGESLNCLVIIFFSLPIYVNFVHFFLGDCFSLFLVFVGLSINEMSYLFLLIKCWMMFFSLSLLVAFRLYVFIILIRCRMAAFLCSCGWHESLGTIESVVVGFL